MIAAATVSRLRSRGYTLIEALVASVILMIGISGASSLTLALITQDEMSQRTAIALNTQESAAELFRLGLSAAEIGALLPDDPVTTSLSVATGVESVAHTPAVPGLPNLSLPYADITVTFNASPSTESWTGRIWTSGDKNASRTLTLRAYRSGTSITVP